MKFRKGICGDCGAQYKLPETFAADKAKCKQCGGSQICHHGKRRHRCVACLEELRAKLRGDNVAVADVLLDLGVVAPGA